MIVRLSQKLAKKCKETDLQVLPRSSNPFLDWHGHLFTHRRTQYFIVSNTISLFSVFMYSIGNSDFGRFKKRFSDSLKAALQSIHADLIYDRIIMPALPSITPAKSSDKRVIGSMNQQIFVARVILDEKEISPFGLAMEVNEVISSMIEYKKPRVKFLGMKTGAN